MSSVTTIESLGAPAHQQPEWPDLQEAGNVLAHLRTLRPLRTPDSAKLLTRKLGDVANGEAFLLQGGDCAETFDDPAGSVENALGVILPMTVTLLSSGIPVVKVPRLAGQFAKPRSSDTETRDGITLPSYRGEIVNGPEFSEEARRPDPTRMLRAYEYSQSAIAQLIRLSTSEFADLERIHEWNQRFAESSSQSERFLDVVQSVERAFMFMRSSGIDVDSLSKLHVAEVFTSHEALLLDYELALTHPDEDGTLFGSSADMLWIGERTRELDEAHVVYCSKIANSIAVKLGPTTTPEEMSDLIERLNPENIPGRLTFIVRMGDEKISDGLPPLLQTAKKLGAALVWECDPMHGNTVSTASGQKTRVFDTIFGEVCKFLDICRDEDTWPGGLHLEMTGDEVTECLGGSEPHDVVELGSRYETNCDPRLNRDQSLELAFLVAEKLGA